MVGSAFSSPLGAIWQSSFSKPFDLSNSIVQEAHFHFL